MHAKKRLHLAYFLPHLTYCSTVWLHCGKRNANVIENLNESILRFVFNDFNNSYEKLLQEINQASLRARRINDMLILVFLALTINWEKTEVGTSSRALLRFQNTISCCCLSSGDSYNTPIVGFHTTSPKFKPKNYRSYRDFTFTMH